jgi:hypothetical protein
MLRRKGCRRAAANAGAVSHGMSALRLVGGSAAADAPQTLVPQMQKSRGDSLGCSSALIYEADAVNHY